MGGGVGWLFERLVGGAVWVAVWGGCWGGCLGGLMGCLCVDAVWGGGVGVSGDRGSQLFELWGNYEKPVDLRPLLSEHEVHCTLLAFRSVCAPVGDLRDLSEEDLPAG